MSNTLTKTDTVIPPYIICRLVNFLADKGYDCGVLLEGTSLCKEDICSPEVRVSFEQINRAILNCENAWRGDELGFELGLELGKHFRVGHLGVIGNLALASKDLKSALLNVFHYLPLRNPLLNFNVERTHKSLVFVFNSDIELGMSRRFITIYLFTCLRMTIIQLLNKRIHSSETYTFKSDIKDISSAHQVLGNHVFTSEQEDSITVDRDALDLNLNSADIGAYKEALKILDASASRGNNQQPSSVNSKVQALLMSHLHNAPSEQCAAKLMGYSERNFRRKLKSENTTYRALLQETRLSHATSMLSSDSMTMECIAYELGYQNTSSFCRAFKNWTGVSPSQWKDSLRPQHSASANEN